MSHQARVIVEVDSASNGEQTLDITMSVSYERVGDLDRWLTRLERHRLIRGMRASGVLPDFRRTAEATEV